VRSLLCTQVPLYCITCCISCFDHHYIDIYPELVFPRGGFPQGHVDQKYLSNLCMLRSVDQHFKVKDLEIVLCVLSYIACANIEIRKHLQRHLKRALNLQNIEQKMG
jgi:hypothetical protein